MDESLELMEVFLDVQRGLPRQGPGCDESTQKALALCVGLPENPAVLDIGCGTGMQTVALAQALGGIIGVFAIEFISFNLSEYFPDIWPILLGGLLLATVLFKPTGIVGFLIGERERTGNFGYRPRGADPA